MPAESRPGPTSRAIASIIRDRAKDRGFNQTQLGERIGLSQQQMSLFLVGGRTLNVDRVQILCDLLDLKMTELFRMAEEQLANEGPNK